MLPNPYMKLYKTVEDVYALVNLQLKRNGRNLEGCYGDGLLCLLTMLFFRGPIYIEAEFKVYPNGCDQGEDKGIRSFLRCHQYETWKSAVGIKASVERKTWCYELHETYFLGSSNFIFYQRSKKQTLIQMAKPQQRYRQLSLKRITNFSLDWKLIFIMESFFIVRKETPILIICDSTNT